MGVRFTSRIKDWSKEKVNELDIAVLEMSTDIHRVSGILAPKLTRALVTSGQIRRVGIAHYQVVYGSSQVPYAKRRHFENFKNPHTLLYLERAGDQTARNFKRYIRTI